MPAALPQQGKGQVLTASVNSTKAVQIRAGNSHSSLPLEQQLQDSTLSTVKSISDNPPSKKNLYLNSAAQKELCVLFNFKAHLPAKSQQHTK